MDKKHTTLGPIAATVQGGIRARVHWGMKVVTALEIIVFPLAAREFWVQGLPAMSVLLVALLVLAIWGFFLADTQIEVDEQGIGITAPHGVYHMDWAEINGAEIKGQTTYLFGENKVIGYSLLFVGKGKRELRDYVTQTIQQQHITAGRPVGFKNSSLRPMMKNTRIRGWKLF